MRSSLNLQTAEDILELAEAIKKYKTLIDEEPVRKFIEENPTLAITLFRTAEQFTRLAKADRESAFLLNKRYSHVVAKLFATVDQVLALAKVDKDAIFNIAEKDPIRIAKLFKNPEDIINLAELNEIYMARLIQKAFSELPQLETAEQVIRLAKADGYACNQLMRANPIFYADLFKTADQLINLYKVDSYEAQSIISKINPDKFKEIFNTADEITKLVEVARGRSEKLFNSYSSHILSLFKTDEQFINFVKADDGSTAMRLIYDNPEIEKVSKLFNTTKAFLQLAKENENIASRFLKSDPAYFSNLFKTDLSIKALYHARPHLALKIIKKNPTLVSALASTQQEFMDIVKADCLYGGQLIKINSNAEQLIKINPDAIIKLIQTPEQVKQLPKIIRDELKEHINPKLLEQDPKTSQIFAALFKQQKTLPETIQNFAYTHFKPT